jgi:hypothetical protein
MGGAVLTVTVPGENRTRPLGDVGTFGRYECDYNGAPRATFCAYQYEGYLGDSIRMYDCATYRIPWGTTGSWHNNQTPGTQPLLTFWNGTTWRMPGAPDGQFIGVDWHPVLTIKNC